MNNITKLKLIYFFKSLFFFSPIITLFYFSRGLDLFQIVALESVLILAVLMAEVPTGILADRIGRKWSVVLLLFFYNIGNIWTIYAFSYFEFIVIEIIFGIAIAFGSGAIEALVYDTLKNEGNQSLMTKTWGSINAYSFVGAFIAMIVGGYLGRSHDPVIFVSLFWMFLVGSSIAFVLAFYIKEPPLQKKVKDKNPLLLFQQSTFHLLRSRPLRKILYLMLFTAPFTHVLMFLFQPYFLSVGTPNVLWGVAMALGTLLGAVLLHSAHTIKQKFGLKMTLFIATLLPGLLYLAMAFFMGPFISMTWYILFAGFSRLRDPILSQYQNDHIFSHNRATVLSIISMITSLYLAVTRFGLGILANKSILLTFIVIGAMIILGAVVFRLDENDVVISN